MEGRMLGISAPSLPILYAHYRRSSIAPMAGSVDCFCSFSLAYPSIIFAPSQSSAASKLGKIFPASANGYGSSG